MIGIIDYEFGNTQSVENSIGFLGFEKMRCSSKNDLQKCTHIILPGVGSFNKCIQALIDLDLYDDLNRSVLNEKKFYLGICVGFQIIFSAGFEGKKTNGFGWIEGECNKLIENKDTLLPHMGWNSIRNQDEIKIFKNMKSQDLNFYFLHSYGVKKKTLNDDNVKIALTQHGEEFISAVEKENIFGVQFHPEKSQSNGLEFLKNFCKQK